MKPINHITQEDAIAFASHEGFTKEDVVAYHFFDGHSAVLEMKGHVRSVRILFKSDQVTWFFDDRAETQASIHELYWLIQHGYDVFGTFRKQPIEGEIANLLISAESSLFYAVTDADWQRASDFDTALTVHTDLREFLDKNADFIAKVKTDE